MSWPVAYRAAARALGLGPGSRMAKAAIRALPDVREPGARARANAGIVKSLTGQFLERAARDAKERDWMDAFNDFIWGGHPTVPSQDFVPATWSAHAPYAIVGGPWPAHMLPADVISTFSPLFEIHGQAGTGGTAFPMPGGPIFPGTARTVSWNQQVVGLWTSAGPHLQPFCNILRLQRAAATGGANIPVFSHIAEVPAQAGELPRAVPTPIARPEAIVDPMAVGPAGERARQEAIPAAYAAPTRSWSRAARISRAAIWGAMAPSERGEVGPISLPKFRYPARPVAVGRPGTRNPDVEIPVVGPTIVWTPNFGWYSIPAVRAEPHVLARAQAGTVEKKVAVSHGNAVAGLISDITEAKDVIDCLWKSLPKRMLSALPADERRAAIKRAGQRLRSERAYAIRTGQWKNSALSRAAQEYSDLRKNPRTLPRKGGSTTRAQRARDVYDYLREASEDATAEFFARAFVCLGVEQIEDAKYGSQGILATEHARALDLPFTVQRGGWLYRHYERQEYYRERNS